MRDGAATPSPPVRGLGATSSPAWSAKSVPAFQNRLRPGDLSWNLIWYVAALGPMPLASPLNPPAAMISDSQTRRRGCRCRRSAADVLSLTTHADSPRRFFHITDDPRNSHARPLYTSLLFPASDHLAGRRTYRTPRLPQPIERRPYLVTRRATLATPSEYPWLRHQLPSVTSSVTAKRKQRCQRRTHVLPRRCCNNCTDAVSLRACGTGSMHRPMSGRPSVCLSQHGPTRKPGGHRTPERNWHQ